MRFSKALAVERNVPLSKTFPDLGFDVVVGWKLPASEEFFRVAEHV
jgi:hypothetical protein